MTTKDAKIDESFRLVTVPSDSAREFIDKLDETHDLWGDGAPWIFRGQNDASWPLIPSLFRKWPSDVPPMHEIALIREFLDNANRANLRIPADALSYFSIMKGKKINSHTRVEDGYGDLIEFDFRNVVFAIAQHSGIPTRLLDFTHDPFVAAYFAAETSNLDKTLGWSLESRGRYFDEMMARFRETGNAGAVMVEFEERIASIAAQRPEELAVWAVRWHDMCALTSLRLVDHPYSEILNLRSQMGVFVYDNNRYEFEENESEDQSWRSFNKELSKLIASGGVYKLTLPCSELKNLIPMLVKKGYHPSMMTPSYELTAKQVIEVNNRYLEERRQSMDEDN